MRKVFFSRKDRLLKERRHDTYQMPGKWPEPTLCPECGAVFSGGRWTWQDSPEQANSALCPACRRISDRYPAGYVELKGPFLREHRDEITNLIRNVESAEKAERPLERIMAVKRRGNTNLVTTTGVHIARRIGEALSRSYKGDLSIRYADGDRIVRVYWRR